jgi:hypothetical protein
MLPADAEPKLLHDAALEWAELLPIRSGHAGVQLTYNQWHLYPAFDDIYALSRRYWGVDVEHMNGTLPRMKAHIKGVSWLTIVGHAWGSRPDIAPRISALSSRPDIQIDRGTNASVIRIGDAPVLGDQNHPTPELDGYYATASALEPLYLTAHPDFPGRFEDTGNTLGWIRRFLEPDDWR